MSNLKDKFESFELEFIEQWGEYRKLHDELNLYRGKEVGDDVQIVNSILFKIQQTFHDLAPAMKFVIERHALLTKAFYDYERFIETLKKSGATQEKETHS